MIFLKYLSRKSYIIDMLLFKARYFKLITILLFKKWKGCQEYVELIVNILIFRTAKESELEDIMDEIFQKHKRNDYNH